jgi:hypothetical protein
MQEDGVTTNVGLPSRGLPALPAMVAYERPRRDIGFHFVDQVPVKTSHSRMRWH